jgi:hypothetical protein
MTDYAAPIPNFRARLWPQPTGPPSDDLCEVLDLGDKPVHEAEAVWQALDA